MKSNRLFIFCLAMVVSNLLGQAAEQTPEKLKASNHSNMVILDETGVKNLRLTTVQAEEQVFEETIFALGRIGVRPGYSAVLSSRVPGRAVEVRALPDHEVEKGEQLVLMESRQPGTPPPQLWLSSPISGVTSEINVVPGEPITPDRSLLTIVNLDSVYAIAAVPEQLAAQVKPGLDARILVPGFPDKVWNTKIEHIGVLADASSGTIEAAFHIDNTGHLLRPGMRAEFNIIKSRREGVMTVPREAVQGEISNRFVFVADDTIPHAFLKVPVEIGSVNDRHAEIKNGLFPGDKVVTTGAYSLSHAGGGSVSLKDALDAAHGHEHNPDGSEMAAGEKSKQPHAPHSHGSPLLMFSLAVNAVLLLLLALLGLKRSTSSQDNTKA